MTIHQFQLPANLNGEQLAAETSASNLYVLDNQLVIESEKSKDELIEIIKNHQPIPSQEPTIEQKLQSVGLSIDDLKVALGLE